MKDNPDKVIDLSDDEKALLAEKKATCPFLGSAVVQGKLPVLNDVNNPLARIGDVKKLGNSGGGDLGEVLVLFASGNHARMKGPFGKLDQTVPKDLFSLELPGSQGSHPGHSGILQGDPETLDSGRLSEADFARLTALAKDGWIKRSDVGHFIAENLLNDPKSKVFDKTTTALFASDLRSFVETIGPSIFSKLFGSDEEADSSHRELEKKLTKLLGEDNLVGSAGEFGLLFALLVNKPGAREIDGEPALAVQDLTTMFVNKRFPIGWESWKKTRIDWVKNTTGLMISAGREYRNRKTQ